MYCVFHSIRFKVNKGWSSAELLFLCPFVRRAVFCFRQEIRTSRFLYLPNPLFLKTSGRISLNVSFFFMFLSGGRYVSAVRSACFSFRSGMFSVAETWKFLFRLRGNPVPLAGFRPPFQVAPLFFLSSGKPFPASVRARMRVRVNYIMYPFSYPFRLGCKKYSLQVSDIQCFVCQW